MAYLKVRLQRMDPIKSRPKKDWSCRNSEMWSLQRMMNISWTEHKSNKNILLELNIERSLLPTIKRRKITYFGLAIRHKTCSTVKKVVQRVIEQRQGRGHVRKKIKRTGLTLRVIYQACEERWQEIVTEAASADRQLTSMMLLLGKFPPCPRVTGCADTVHVYH